VSGAAATEEATRSARAAAQWLTAPREPVRPREVVRHLVAIQAQLPSAAALAVRARASGTSAVDVATAYGAGDLVRTWLFRGTLHVVAAEDVDWLLGLVRHTIIARTARRRSELGLDDATLEQSAAVLNEALAGGQPRTRSELFGALSTAGIDPAGQRGIHLIRSAALTGTVCFGPDRGHEPTWVARRPRPDRRTRPKALAELGRRYRVGYGPTDSRDLAAWAGLAAVDARQAWTGAAGAEQHRGTGVPAVRLLPHFDPYLLGYRTRDPVVAPAHAPAVWTGGGYIMPTVVADGVVVATWEAVRRPGSMSITVRPFTGLGDDLRAGIDDEVADVGRFLGTPATWTVAATVVRG
jgi:hypothetical protein